MSHPVSLTLRKKEHRLANQWALPDAQQQFLEFIELLAPKLSTPLALNGAQNLVDLCIGRMSSFSQADHSRSTFIGRVEPDDIPDIFEAPKQLIHGLFAHAGALSQHARAYPFRTGKLKHCHMRYDEFLKAGSIKLFNDAALDDLTRNAQQGPDEHILSFD